VGRLLATLPAAAGYVRRLRRAIVEIEPDLVHSNSLKMHLLAAWAAPRGVPVIWHLHDYVSARPLMSHLLPPHVRRCAAMIANSKSVADDARAALAPARIFTVYNAVDLRRFAPHGRVLDLDALAGMGPLPEGAVRVGLVATMARWKGHVTFLEALAALPCVPVRGYVVGGPVYQTTSSQYALDELRATAARLGLAERVGFTGFVADAAAAMRSLDIVVHASTAPEPFGLVIAEAMASARGVIASAAGGAAELIDDGVNALGYSPGDVAALRGLIARAANDRGLRVRLGEAARASAERMFTRERMAAEVASIYAGLAASVR
jgi:glycosyltransferase involved in cell wall biosynthesis